MWITGIKKLCAHLQALDLNNYLLKTCGIEYDRRERVSWSDALKVLPSAVPATAHV